MNDRHMRILRHMARQTRSELARDDTLAPAGGTGLTGRRDYLKRAAKRARGQLAAAEQRRQT